MDLMKWSKFELHQDDDTCLPYQELPLKNSQTPRIYPEASTTSSFPEFILHPDDPSILEPLPPLRDLCLSKVLSTLRSSRT